MYVKLFTSIFDGSLYGQFEPTVTFIAMLALADEKGVVDMTPEAIAAKSGFPIDVVRKGIEHLALPDPRSRTKTEECQGRRILPLDPERDWGWLITNYTKYRQIRTAEERREYFRQYKAKARAEQKSTESTASTKVHPKPPILESYAEADTDSESEGSKTGMSNSGEFDTSIKTVFWHWQEIWGKQRSKLDAKRLRLIRSALDNYSEADLCQAISGYKNSPHHTGQNERATIYDDIGLFLRDSAHIDAGLNFYKNPPRTDLSPLTRRNVAAIGDWQPPEMKHAK